MKVCRATEASDDTLHDAAGPVLLVSPWYRPIVGGVVEVADRLLHFLDRAGVETHLLVLDETCKSIEADSTAKNVWRFQIPTHVFYQPGLRAMVSMLMRGPLAFWRLMRFVRSLKVRTVILLYPISYAWPFLLLGYACGVRLIASYHGKDLIGYSSYSPLLKWLFRRVLQDSDAITVCASHLAEEAQELYPGKPLPIRLIPNCVNVEKFVPPPPDFIRTDARTTLVHVSNFAPKKRTREIVKAFANDKIPLDSRLVMVGAGGDFEEVVEFTRSLGIDDRVEFVGAQKDVRSYLWQADLFVMASEDEGDPLALLEAMACGLAWVSTAWGAAAILPPGECGLVVPCRSPHLLTAAMVELITDPKRRYAMGQRGRRRAVVDFGEDKYTQRHLELIQEVERDIILPSSTP